MARQLGIIKVAGTLEDLTYMQTQDGYIVKKKSSISRNRLKYSDAFAPTRLENSEFKTAATASNLLRQSVLPLWENENYGRIQNRLTKLFRQVLDADRANERGSHKISNGEIGFLKGFQFNTKAELHQIIHARPVTEFNRSSGEIIIRIETFMPSAKSTEASSATHFQLVSAGVDINFEEGKHTTVLNASGVLPLDLKQVQVVELKHVMNTGTSNILFALLGIRFYQEVNGHFYSIKNRKYSALTIVDVQNKSGNS